MVSSDLDWMQEGRCADVQTDAFFPERGTAQVTARDAKLQCNGLPGQAPCPIREACLEFALERKERHGIWGGMSERERAKVAKNRRIAAEDRRQFVRLESVDRRRVAIPSHVTNYDQGLITIGELKQELVRKQGQGLLTAGEVAQEIAYQEHRTALAVSRTKGNRGTTQAEGRARRVA